MNTHPASRADQSNPVALLQSAPPPNRDGSASFSAMLERSAVPDNAREPQSRPPESRSGAESRAEDRSESPNERQPERGSDARRSDNRRGEREQRTSEAPRETSPQEAGRPAQPDAEAVEGEELPAGFAAISAILAAFDARPATPTGSRFAGLDADLDEDGQGDAASGRKDSRLLLLGLGQPKGEDSASNPIKPATTLLQNDNSQLSRSTFNAALAARAEATLNGFQAALQGEGAQPGTPLVGNLVASSRSESVALPQLQVTTPAGQRAWAEDVGNRMLWMIGRNESKAELVLTPPSLGKLGVSIQVNGDQTTAHFVAATQAAREALEHAMPRLREMLQQAGIQLGQTNVSTSDQQQAQRDDGSGEGRSRNNGSGSGPAREGEDAMSPAEPGRWVRAGSGVIDLFA